MPSPTITAPRETAQQRQGPAVGTDPDAMATASTVSLWPRASAGDPTAAAALISRMLGKSTAAAARMAYNRALSKLRDEMKRLV